MFERVREMATLVFHADTETETVCVVVRAVAAAGGLEPLPATRLGLAVAELAGQAHGDLSVELTKVTDGAGETMRAVVRGGGADCMNLPEGLVDSCTSRGTPAGVEQVLVVSSGHGTAAVDPDQPLMSTVDSPADTRRLLSEALVALDRQTGQLISSDAESQELTSELAQTNQNLLALYAQVAEYKEQLQHAWATAERATEAKVAFIDNLSHEMRSPLNSLINFADLLLVTDVRPEQREYAETMRAAATHLRGIVDDIGDLSTLEAGQLRLQRVSFDLVGCVEEALGIVAPEAQRKRLALACLFDPDTPTAVVGDPERLRQVLVNLLSNAVKFTAHGEVSVEVALASRTAGRCELSLMIRDTGIGIGKDVIERLFVPFTQVDTPSTADAGGMGLGLALCRELCRRMGGGITVESNVGAGSTFTCTVVLEDSGAPALDDAGDKPLRDLTVAVVHAQRCVREAIRRHLETWGATVVVASTVAEGAMRLRDAPHTAIAVVAGESVAQVDTVEPVFAAVRHGAQLPLVAVTPLAAGHRGEPTGSVRAAIAAPVRRGRLRQAVLRALDRSETAVPAAPTTVQVDPRPPLRVLVAEDDAASRRAAALMLDRLGCYVGVVTNGSRALSAIIEGEYDLVLMDLNMPELDGQTATRQARELLGDRPQIFAITGSTTEDVRATCLAAGMNGFLSKPILLEDLSEALEVARRQLQHTPQAGSVAHPSTMEQRSTEAD